MITSIAEMFKAAMATPNPDRFYLSREAWLAYRSEWLKLVPNVRALHAAGWAGGFIVNGYHE